MIKNKIFRKWYFKICPRKFTEKLSNEIELDYQKIFKTKPSPAELYEAKYERDYNMRMIWDDLGIYLSNKMMSKAKKYDIPLSSRMPVPETPDPVGEDWDLSGYGFYYLSDKGRYDLKIKIREEQKVRNDKFIQYISLLIGFLGLIVALVSQLGVKL